MKPRCGAFALVLFTFTISWGTISSAQPISPEALDPTKPPPGLSPLNSPAGVSVKQSPDIGTLEIVQRFPKPEMFTPFAEQTWFHIDNVFLSPTPFASDAWLTRAGLSYVPWSTYRWTPRVIFEQAFLHFRDAPSADYNGQTLVVMSQLDLTDDKHWSWDAGVVLRRLEADQPGIGEFYRQVAGGMRLNWLHPLSKSRPVFLYTSAGANWREASPDWETRLDSGVLVSVIWHPTPTLGVQPFVQPAYYWFPNDSAVFTDRQDFNLRAGVNLIWRPAKKFWLGASFLWVRNFSSESGADYEILPSISLSANAAFW